MTKFISMNPLQIISNYYQPQSSGFQILVEHSRAVANLAVEIAHRHPTLNADISFLYEAAMLHDIGIFKTHAPDLDCHGTLPYICHGSQGRAILDMEGYPLHALVCERHTGTGISLQDIVAQNMPIPHRDMLPLSIEERIICYADKFFSKSGPLSTPKSIDRIRQSLLKFGPNHVARFDQWHQEFAIN